MCLLVVFMFEGVVCVKYGEFLFKVKEDICVYVVVVENVGWFFGEDIFIVMGGIFLMKGFFDFVGI